MGVSKERKQSVEYIANCVARRHGHNVATRITYADVPEPTLGKTTGYGYVKNTTGEYVFNAYRRNFGWKNTHYQAATCEVILPLSMKPKDEVKGQVRT